MKKWFQEHLLKQWKVTHKKWSTWLITSGVSIILLAGDISEVLLHVWKTVPDDLKGNLPTEWIIAIGAIIILAAIPAGAIRQKNLRDFRESEGEGDSREDKGSSQE